MKDVRILEGIFPIFIRDEFIFVVSLDLSLAREVLVNHIRYWCLNLTVSLIIFASLTSNRLEFENQLSSLYSSESKNGEKRIPATPRRPYLTYVA